MIMLWRWTVIYLKFACLIVGAMLALTRVFAYGLLFSRNDCENMMVGAVFASEVFGIIFFVVAMVFICLSMK